jgi:hypothetical protein
MKNRVFRDAPAWSDMLQKIQKNFKNYFILEISFLNGFYGWGRYFRFFRPPNHIEKWRLGLLKCIFEPKKNYFEPKLHGNSVEMIGIMNIY